MMPETTYCKYASSPHAMMVELTLSSFKWRVYVTAFRVFFCFLIYGLNSTIGTCMPKKKEEKKENIINSGFLI